MQLAVSLQGVRQIRNVSPLFQRLTHLRICNASHPQYLQWLTHLETSSSWGCLTAHMSQCTKLTKLYIFSGG